VPVVVTGAGSVLGRAVLTALRAAGVPEIRATVPERVAAAGPRALGVPTAVSDLSDPLTTGAVLEGAHTVIHLHDPATTYGWLREAAQGTGLRRVVIVLPAGVQPPAPGAGSGAASDEWELVVLTGDVRHADPALVTAILAADRRRPPAL
jgi:uncharacterized protein YbjT (DUF2867 family)